MKTPIRGSFGRARRPAQRAAGAALAALFLLVAASGALAAEGFPDWRALAEVGVIDVLTLDDDGDLRESPVWFVLVAGEPYLRTSDSVWLANILRDESFRVRIEGLEYEVSAVHVEGDEIIARVDAASAEKYGLQESLIHFFRMRRPDILRIVPKRQAQR